MINVNEQTSFEVGLKKGHENCIEKGKERYAKVWLGKVEKIGQKMV
jgi:hypothetical protein